ncbi:MAG: hypothetical protein K8T90_15380 [Planctomycetes bacterium]|nr:hypothetical protein [Planctomycetota bacterium]
MSTTQLSASASPGPAGSGVFRRIAICGFFLAGAAQVVVANLAGFAAPGGRPTLPLVSRVMVMLLALAFGRLAWRDRARWRILRWPMQAIGLIVMGYGFGMLAGMLAEAWSRYVA